MAKIIRTHSLPPPLVVSSFEQRVSLAIAPKERETNKNRRRQREKSRQKRRRTWLVKAARVLYYLYYLPMLDVCV